MTSLTHVAALRLGRRRGHARDVWSPAGVPVTIAPSWWLGIGLTAWTVGDTLLPDAAPGRLGPGAYTAAAVATAADSR